jgi:mannose-6-phosphate isomerase-like protein (cupin superfamily)
MEIKSILANMANGMIHYVNRAEPISTVEWTPHPKFKGVCLKHIIKGKDTNGLFSAHLVRIDPHCCLDTHCHENQLELHKIIEGHGSCQLVENQFEVHLGKMTLIPKGQNHKVQAGEKGLALLAEFFPALL